MKKLLLLVTVVFCIACSDGDLQIESVDFDGVSIQSCSAIDTTTTLFLKINSSEALILDIANGLLKNENSTDTITSNLNNTLGNSSTLIYRVFSDNVTTDYFCDEIPPASPTVVEEIIATQGNVLIFTEVDSTDANTFNHNISLQEVLLESNGESINDLTLNEFGTISTTKPN